MNMKSGKRDRTSAMASGQNGASIGALPSPGHERSPHVRWITSGSSNMAMSQRTPSQRSAICSSSAIIAWRSAAER